jgi:hypothetical protein
VIFATSRPVRRCAGTARRERELRRRSATITGLFVEHSNHAPAPRAVPDDRTSC